MKKRIWAVLFSLVLFSFFSQAVVCSPAFAAPAGSLSMAKFLFADDVAGLGQYTPKQGTRFAIGDICTVYIEASGFVLEPKPDAEGEFALDLAVDLNIKMARSGRMIVSEKDFNTLQTTVRSQLTAVPLPFYFRFEEGWDPGSYVIELTLRDNLSGQSAAGELPYLLEEPTEADLARQAEENQTQQ